MKTILNFPNALDRFRRRTMTMGYDAPAIKEFDLNQRRYKIIELDGTRYLAMFKREVFKCYGDFFPEDKDKVGESVNVKDLKEALGKENIQALMYLYKDGSVYYVYIRDLLNHWHQRETLREMKNIYCFGISHLKQLIGVEE